MSFLVICCISCNKSPKCCFLVKQNESVVYKNYVVPKTIPFSLVNWNNKYLSDTFDAKSNIKKIDLKVYGKNVFRFFLKECNASFEEYEKNQLKEDYIYVPIDTIGEHTDMFFCGKLSLQANIESLVIFMYEHSNLSSIHHVGSLLLFNIKRGQIYSIVELSVNCAYSKSYLMQNNYFTQIYEGVYSPLIPEEFISELRLNENNTDILFYSKFKIDKDGYVQILGLTNAKSALINN